jgi:superfamily II DNA or RNA helicase
MDERLRQVLYKKHNDGEFKILSCSKLLNTGYDAPSVRCLIDCYPTKSIISYQQRTGRIMRINPGKEYAIYLDHASNVGRFGFAEDIVATMLDDGEKKFVERDQVKDTKEKKQHNCPQCQKIMLGIRCSCGYEFPIKERLETDSSTLVQLASAKAYAQADKSMWYSGLLTHARNKGYSDGWAAHKYKSKYGVWPRSLDIKVGQIPLEVSNWILSENIRYGHRNNKWKKVG